MEILFHCRLIVGIEAVEGKAHAVGRRVVADVLALAGVEGPGRKLLQEGLLELAVFGKGGDVIVGDGLDRLYPEIAIKASRRHLARIIVGLGVVAGAGLAVQAGADGHELHAGVVAVAGTEGGDELPIGIQVVSAPVLGNQPAAYVHDRVRIVLHMVGRPDTLAASGLSLADASPGVGADAEASGLAAVGLAAQPGVDLRPIVTPRRGVLYPVPVEGLVPAREVVARGILAVPVGSHVDARPAGRGHDGLRRSRLLPCARCSFQCAGPHRRARHAAQHKAYDHHQSESKGANAPSHISSSLTLLLDRTQ